MSTHENTAATAGIAESIERYYFQGLYLGRVDLLKEIFDPRTILVGDIKGKPYSKTLLEYLDGVGSRISPLNSDKPFQGEILSIDVINSTAVAKVRVRMYDFNYYDFLCFHKAEHRWLIVNKMLTHVEEARQN